ncbi:MAG: hypothetical protein H5T96_09030, partial [Tissierellales bacterium]|nr:hypothetical protein [Tissierellales bacterium]
TGLVRYIGQTKQYNPIKRYYQHKYQWSRCKGSLSHVNSWIKSLYNENLFPKFEIIEDNIKEEELDKYELGYILLFKSIGTDLTNLQEISEMRNYKRFTQKDEWKKKRLKSLENSDKWKERNKRHSEIIKNKHKEGKSRIGFKYLSDDQKKDLHNRAMKVWQKKVCSINKNGEIIKIFDTIKLAGEFYNIEPTHITRVCKGKSKSGITHGQRFRYYTEDI